MVGIILVSHSPEISTGTANLVRQMAGEVPTFPVGGSAGGDLGTDPERIQRAIEETETNEILVFVDIGSAIMSAESALEMLDDELRAKVHLVDAPFVEGAFAAGVMASTGANASECIEAAAETRTESKLG